jgi:peptide/nickel transport system substrate-binding protein
MERMAKTEKVFDMLRLIKEYPNLTAQDLARLCDVSERGIYRYLNTLSKAGILVRFKDGGYKLQEDYSDALSEVFRRTDPETLEALMVLLSAGMENCEDDHILERGRDFIKLIETSFPKVGKLRLNEIQIVPEGRRSAHYGGTVTIGHSSKPDIINPILTSETISVHLMNLIFSSLVRFDSAQRPVPDLAKSWEVSKDGLVWTFFLRDDVKFHDGHPLTAQDVEFTYRAIMNPENMSPVAERYKLIDRIETEGDHIFRVALRHPFAPLIHRLSREIAPKHLLESADLRNTPFNRHPVGSGPFKLADWTEDDTVILDANGEYFEKDRPILDRLIFKTYPDRGAALEAISRGKMDIALNLAASDLLFVSRRRPFRVYSAPGASYYAITFNLRDPIFSDIRVRMALDYAIDKESIIKNQLKGYSRTCTGPFAVNSWAYNPNIQPIPYDIGHAIALLDQVGWRDTDGDGVLDRDGEPFEISLAVPNISDSLERIAVAIRAQLMKIGITMKLVYVDDSKLYETLFQAMLTKSAAGADPDYAYRAWHSEGGDANLTSYENRLVDDLLEQGRRTTDLEKRKAIYYKIHEIVHDDYPAIFLASGCEFIGSNYRFSDARFSSLLHFLTTAKDWHIIGGEREDTIHKRQREVNIS